MEHVCESVSLRSDLLLGLLNVSVKSLCVSSIFRIFENRSDDATKDSFGTYDLFDGDMDEVSLSFRKVCVLRILFTRHFNHLNVFLSEKVNYEFGTVFRAFAHICKTSHEYTISHGNLHVVKRPRLSFDDFLVARRPRICSLLAIVIVIHSSTHVCSFGRALHDRIVHSFFFKTITVHLVIIVNRVFIFGEMV